MHKILLTLITVRLRKILPKDDYFAYLLFFIFYTVIAYFFSSVYFKFSKYILLFSLEILLYHSNRRDLELLKLRKNYLLIIFIEYLLYSLPTLFIILINEDFINLLLFLVLLAFYTIIPKCRFKIIKFPFKFFDPFWTISFRKNKLYLYIPIIIFISIMGNKSNNSNLNYFSILVISIISSIPSFQRESLDQIKVSSYLGNLYLKKHTSIVVYNSIFLIIPLIVLIVFYRNWELIYFLPAIVVLPVINILFKYTFFDNAFLHIVFFALFLGNIQYGIPLVLIPFLYHYGVKKIKIIQHA
nr:hypothetical protein [uncultured Flavobacterium sp.]